jgi:hydroxyacylglutathione hydrolase
MIVHPILALTDNYIWCLVQPNRECVIVDPSEASPVFRYLEQHALTLTAILITHKHYDHTGGISELIKAWPVPVYGSEQIPSVSVVMDRDRTITLTGSQLQFEVFLIPGHTLEHVAYYHPEGHVFTGDTLFTGGCGKIFEGTAQQMYHSLLTLKALPKETLVYCGHEYTENNLKFAQVVEPQNRDIEERLLATQTLRRRQQPTVPAPLSIELKTNPFLRCDHPDVIAAASAYCMRSLQDPVEVLATLRTWKNHYS